MTHKKKKQRASLQLEILAGHWCFLSSARLPSFQHKCTNTHPFTDMSGLILRFMAQFIWGPATATRLQSGHRPALSVPRPPWAWWLYAVQLYFIDQSQPSHETYRLKMKKYTDLDEKLAVILKGPL